MIKTRWTLIFFCHCGPALVASVNNNNESNPELPSNAGAMDVQSGNGSSLGLSTDTVIDNSQEDVICSLCANPQHRPSDLLARFEKGAGQSITCGEAHNLGQMELPPENCTYLQSWGQTLCGCAPFQEDQPTWLECRLCEDGSKLPDGFMAGWPQTTCAELQVQANRDEPRLCTIYQATVGTYCGCDNRKATTEMCRICGDTKALPDHLKTIERHRSKTCGELEFDANLPEGDCRLFQKLYADQCCQEDDATTPPIRSHVGSVHTGGYTRILWQTIAGVVVLGGGLF